MTPATLSAPATTTWNIDAAHSEVGFEVKHLMIAKVRGRFAGVTGAITLDESDLTASSVDVSIDVSTIDTRQEQRDAHLRSGDFFDAESFPTLTFHSSRVEAVGSSLRITGDLTIRGVTREVVLDATNEGRANDPWGGERIAFSAQTKIDRRDFGLTWNQALEAGGVAVGHDIKIAIEVEAVKA